MNNADFQEQEAPATQAPATQAAAARRGWVLDIQQLRAERAGLATTAAPNGRPADQYAELPELSDNDRLEIAAGWADEPGSPYVRRVKVQQRHTQRPAGPRSVKRDVSVPSLTLSGKWLADVGLTEGATAIIEVTPAGLAITAAAAPARRAEEPAATYAAARFVPRLLHPDIRWEIALPENGTDFKLPQLYALLACQRIEVVYVGATGLLLIIDEEGTFPADAQRNPLAETIWWQHEPDAIGAPLFGRALLCHTTQLR